MRVVAVTGGIGCGKSAATEIFSELGVDVVDVDVISHALTSHQLTGEHSFILKEISAHFGADILDETGALKRAQLRNVIFKDATKRHLLESILHPAIYKQASLEIIKNTQHDCKLGYQILAIPLLSAASNYYNLIDHTVVIDCNESLQISRTIARSQLSEIEVKAIINNQISREQRLKLADDVIENEGNLAELRKKIELFHEKYINTCIVRK